MLKRSMLLQKAKNFILNILALNQVRFKEGSEMTTSALSPAAGFTEAVHRAAPPRSRGSTATYPGSVRRSQGITSSSPLGAGTRV